jgi:hypothetical protein
MSNRIENAFKNARTLAPAVPNKKQKTDDTKYKVYNLTYQNMDVQKIYFDKEWKDDVEHTAKTIGVHYNVEDPGYFNITCPQLTVGFKGFTNLDASKGEDQLGISLYNKNIIVNDPELPVAERKFAIKEGLVGNELILANEALVFYKKMNELNKTMLEKALQTKTSKSKKDECIATYSSIIKSYKSEKNDDYPRVELIRISLNSFENKITTTFFESVNGSLQQLDWNNDNIKEICTGGAEVRPIITANRLWVGGKTSLKFRLKSLVIIKRGSANKSEPKLPFIPSDLITIQDVPVETHVDADDNDEQYQ